MEGYNIMLFAVALTLLALAPVVLAGAVVLAQYNRHRPNRMMKWAARRRRAMDPIESIMWLAARRGQRASVLLRTVIDDELTPLLRHVRDVMQEFAEALASVEIDEKGE